MKLITAIVRPEKLDEVIDAVVDYGGRGLTLTEVRGFGQQFGVHPAKADMTTDGLPRYSRAVLLTKFRLDILVLDENVRTMVEAIAKHAHTAMIGDGKIWVSPVDAVRRIRTGEQDRDAV